MPTNSIFDSFQTPLTDFFKGTNLPKPPLTPDLLAQIFTKGLGDGKSSGDIATEIFGHLPEAKQTPQAHAELEKFTATAVTLFTEGKTQTFADAAELTDTERAQILDQAAGRFETPYKWGGSTEKGIDCSNLVHRAYQGAGFDYGYTMTTSDWEKAGFKETTDPKPGDLILWAPLPGKANGHVGIVLDAEGKTFIGAQRSTGVAEETYAQNKYWGKRPHIFLRYEKPSVSQ